MGDAGDFVERYADEVLGCILFALADSFRNFGCLAQTAAYVAVFVTDNNECCEAHVAAALYDLCDTLDGYNLIFQLHLACINHCTFHRSISSLEFQAGLTGSICESGNFTHVDITAAVEDYFFDSLFGCSLSDHLTDFLSCRDIISVLNSVLDFLFDGACGHEGVLGVVVDDLCVDVFIASINGKTRALRCSAESVADSGVLFLADRLPVCFLNHSKFLQICTGCFRQILSQPAP